MSGGGGKSGSESTETSLPEWLRGPAERNLGRAEDVQRLGYMPYRGPEVAAFSPNQLAAMQNNNDAARAFGFAAPGGASEGMPTPELYAGGIKAYDSNAIYDQALADTQAYQPETVDQYNALFGSNVATTANPNPLPTGRPSSGGGSFGGVDPNMLAIQKLRDDRANASANVNYNTSGSGSNPFGYLDNPTSPGHPSNQNYNYTPNYQASIPNTTMDDTAAIEAGMTPPLSSRFDRVGATPQTYSAAPESTQMLMARQADAMERARLNSLGISTVGK